MLTILRIKNTIAITNMPIIDVRNVESYNIPDQFDVDDGIIQSTINCRGGAYC